MNYKKLPAVIAVSTVLLGGFALFSKNHNATRQNLSVTKTIQLTNSQKISNGQVTVSGKVWFEGICPSGESANPKYCSNRVYLVSPDVSDLTPDTPRIALTENNIFVSCNDDGGKTCRDYLLDKHYTVQGVINNKIKLGNNTTVIEVTSHKLDN